MRKEVIDGEEADYSMARTATYLYTFGAERRQIVYKYIASS
jgi:hypothetical protein